VALLALLRSRFVRYQVHGGSMAPALQPGDYLVADLAAYTRRMPSPGDLVLATDPREATRTVVKRVERVDLHRQAWLTGDNATESTDSRVFGAIPADLVRGRIVFRYHPLSRLGFPR
ncbi:MAG: S26 family signal peptidase, partial [Dehalococcoidia bacterium]